MAEDTNTEGSPDTSTDTSSEEASKDAGSRETEGSAAGADVDDTAADVDDAGAGAADAGAGANDAGADAAGADDAGADAAAADDAGTGADAAGADDAGVGAGAAAAGADGAGAGADGGEDRNGDPASESTGDGDEFDTFPALGPDGLDPELVNLSRPRQMRIGVVMSLSVLVFCGYIMYKIYPDLQFARSSEDPTAFGSAAEMLRDANPEQLVRVRAVPDRAFAIHVAHSVADDGSRLTPIQGTDGKLWLMVGGSVWKAFTHSEVYTGRLRRVRDLPFYDSLRAHVVGRERGPRFVTPNAARTALDARQSVVIGPSGDRIPVADSTPTHVYETVADKARIQVFSTERRPRERDLTRAMKDAGLITAEFKPERGPKDSWIYVVDIPGGADAAWAKLRDAKLFHANAQPIKRIYETTWARMASQGERLVAGNNALLWSNVTWVAVEVPRALPSDAMVLITQETPGEFWYVLPLFVILGLAALFFAYPLVRKLTGGTAKS